MRKSGSSLRAVLGPVILYAAAAVGVFHLIYATRAGAVYGLAMIPFILFFCLIKCPALCLGNEFTVATSRLLADSYIGFGCRTLCPSVMNCFFLSQRPRFP